MRVSLKSPVRQFRTPGSVRGLSGNWQTYRDVEGKGVAVRRGLEEAGSKSAT